MRQDATEDYRRAVACLAVGKRTTVSAVALALVIGGTIGYAWPAPGHPTAWTDIRTWVCLGVAIVGADIALVLDGRLRELEQGAVPRNVSYPCCGVPVHKRVHVMGDDGNETGSRTGDGTGRAAPSGEVASTLRGAGTADDQAKRWLESVKNNRNTAAMAFIGFLVGIAYQGVVTPAIQYINGSMSFPVVSQFIIFVILGLWTFLLGSYSMTLSPFAGWAWFANFLMLTLSGFILIFMASATISSTTAPTRVGFVEYYLIYFIIEAVWALGTLTWAARQTSRHPGLFRQQLPFAALSILPFVVVLVIQLTGNSHAHVAIILLLIITIFAFTATIGLLARRHWI